MTESTLIIKDGWIARLRPAESGLPGRLLLMLHGYTGDEDSMWIFARKFPENFWILTPRAPYPAEGGGYSWLPPGGGLHSTVEDYLPKLNYLLEWMDALVEIKPARRPMDLAGFSQGAAASYALTLAHPERVHRLAGLAGFMPRGTGSYLTEANLENIPVFLSHGTQDERIRIEAGYEAAMTLTKAGAAVDFCSADTGHKLNAECHRRLVQFFVDGLASSDEGNEPHKDTK